MLLHATRLLAPPDYQLRAMHVHHGLSSNADGWANFCERECAKLGIPLDVVRVEVRSRTRQGVEAEARQSRFNALFADPADRILLGHHANDQAETLLHNLLRGSGVRGAAAIPERHGRILHPLLRLTRLQLASYADMHAIRWIDDESNADLRFTRNYLRHRILPAALGKFPRAVEQLAAAAARFADASDLLDELALEDLKGNPAEFPLPLALILPLSDRRAVNLLRYLLFRQGKQAPSEDQVNEFVRQLREAAPDRHPRLDLPAYTLVRRRTRLHFELRG